MRLHPIIKRMPGDEVLQKMGARPLGEAERPASKGKVVPAKTKSVKAGAKAAVKGSSSIN